MQHAIANAQDLTDTIAQVLTIPIRPLSFNCTGRCNRNRHMTLQLQPAQVFIFATAQDCSTATSTRLDNKMVPTLQARGAGEEDVHARDALEPLTVLPTEGKGIVETVLEYLPGHATTSAEVSHHAQCCNMTQFFFSVPCLSLVISFF